MLRSLVGSEMCIRDRYIHSRGLLPPDRILLGAKFTLRPSLAFSYIGKRYCTSLEQPASFKLCGMVQGMEVHNVRRGRHLYWAGRPSRWASAHVVVISISIDQVATWYGGRPLLRPYCVRRGLSSLSQKGTALPNFRLVSIVAKRLDGSKRHFVGR